MWPDTTLARWGVFPPYAAAVEAAAVRNRWGETSTPRVPTVILETRIPRFFVVMGLPVVEEIQRAFMGGLDPSRTGRDSFICASRWGSRNAGGGLSTPRRDFVLMPGK